MPKQVSSAGDHVRSRRVSRPSCFAHRLLVCVFLPLPDFARLLAASPCVHKMNPQKDGIEDASEANALTLECFLEEM